MIKDWQLCLLDRAEEWRLPKSGEWNFLFYNNYHPHISSMSVFWFYNREQYPRVVTKLFHSPEIPEREFVNLRRTHEAVPNTAPRPLHFGRVGGCWTLWMTGVPGVQLGKLRADSPALLTSITATITDMHRALAIRGDRPQPDRYRRMVTEPLESVAKFGVSASVWEGCRRLSGLASAEWLAQIPVVPQHGDLYSGHLLVDRDRVHIIDWESFGLIDLPFYDLCTLFISILWERSNTPAGWDVAVTARIPDLVRAYFGRLELDEGTAALLLPLALLNWFHIQWRDGRQEFATRMHLTLSHYFENVDLWNRTFIPTKRIP